MTLPFVGTLRLVRLRSDTAVPDQRTSPSSPLTPLVVKRYRSLIVLLFVTWLNMAQKNSLNLKIILLSNFI